MATHIYRIPRNSLALMLCAHLAAIAPHVKRLPLWLLLLSVGCIVWRVMVYQGRWRFPGRLIRAALVAVGGCAIIWAYNATLSSEAGVALLVMSFSLKLLEMYRKRDAYLQILLAYFVIGSGFLFYTSIWVFLYLLVVFILVTAALIGLNQNGMHVHPWRTLRLSMLMCVQAMPIVVALFIFFPRVAPIWALSVKPDNALSGLSESMTPADIAHLAGKSALAFRVTFDGTPPPHHELYWRAMVFTHFDGKTWSRRPHAGAVDTSPVQVLNGRGVEKGVHQGVHQEGVDSRDLRMNRVRYIGRPYRYAVMMEPTLNTYLVALDMPIVNTSSIAMMNDYHLMHSSALREVFRYSVVSYLNYRAGMELDNWTRVQSLQLPEGQNPRALALAQRWFDEAHGDPSVYVRRVLTNFGTDRFYYTLRPPKLNDHIVDRFLFDSKRGYCAHFAGAFVFLMRAVGLPARVVAGYMGGELNSIGRFVSVRQFEAHAWAEVWLAGKGWVRMDPTAEVAPSRVLESVQEALREEGSFLASEPFSPIRFGDNRLVRHVRQTFDYMNYVWNQNIVGFDDIQQRNFLKKYFNAISAQVLAIVSIVLLCVITVAAALILLRIRPSIDVTEVDVLYQRFQRYLKVLGLIRHPGETPSQFQARASEAYPPIRDSISRFTVTYLDQQYAPRLARHQNRAMALRMLRTDLRTLRRFVYRRGKWV